MIENIQDTKQLNNGTEMPWFGLGVWKSEEGEEVINAVQYALNAGYRHIDTAAIYENEEGVGKAIRKSSIPREEVFITTKIWNDDQRENNVSGALETSLKKLGTDYVDLYLIHWPVKGKYKRTWEEMEKLYQQGKTRAIGVSNFMVSHLEDLLSDSSTVPAINQVEFHPHLVQNDLLNFCRDKNIQMEAWSPIMQGNVVNVDEIKKLSEKYGKTPAQIVIRWDLDHHVITIPKSVHKDRIEENADIFDFELSKEDIAFLDSLDKHHRYGPDPNDFDF